MYRSPDDIALLTELAGVLDQTIGEAGLTSGSYLVLRQLMKAGKPMGISAMAMVLEAEPDEVAEVTRRLAENNLVVVRGQGIEIVGAAARRIQELDDQATEAMRAHVLDRAHSPTVYGLVAAMQGGRFTVDDLIDFLNEGPDDEE